MIIRQIDELEIVGIFDRGVPNKERIVIKTKQEVRLGRYFLFLGLPLGDDSIYPINGDQFWFGDEIVASSTWIFIYTGMGEKRFTRTRGSHEPALVLHWGRQYTVFDNPNIVPAIISAEGVFVGPHSGTLNLSSPTSG